MRVKIPLTPEKEELLLKKLIANESLYMDITFHECPIPLTSLDLALRIAIGMTTKSRKAILEDIPKIREFFDTLKLIEERCAK